MPPLIDKKKCKRCSRCIEVCPSDVFFGSKRGEVPNITYPEECWHCNACVEVCVIKGAVRLRIPLPMIVLYKKRERRVKK